VDPSIDAGVPGISLSVPEFLIALTLCAAALALWINIRFPNLAPKGVRTAILHVGAAMLVGQIVVPFLHAYIPVNASPVVRALITTFALGFPALVYALLTSIWVIRIAQGALRR
jgi:hypothetical protein